MNLIEAGLSNMVTSCYIVLDLRSLSSDITFDVITLLFDVSDDKIM